MHCLTGLLLSCLRAWPSIMTSLLSDLSASNESSSGRETKYLPLWPKRAFCMVFAFFWLRTLEPEEP